MKRKSLILLIVVVGLLVSLSTAGLAEKKTIEMWTFASNNFEEFKARKAELEEKFNVNCKIELLTTDAIITRLQSAAATGQGWPDVIECLYDQTRQLCNSNPKKAALLPLNKWVKKSKVVKNVIQSRINRYTINGNIYGLPNDIHPSLLIYNDPAWKAAGVDLTTVKTWDDYFVAAKKVCPNPEKDKVYAIAGDGGGLFEMMWQQSDAQLLDKKGNPILTGDKFKSFVNKYLEYYHTGTVVSWDWNNFWNLMATGKLLSTVAPDWWLNAATLSLAKTDVEGKMRAIPLPAWKKGGVRTATWGGSFKSIPRGAKDPDFSYQVLEWMQYAPEAVKARYTSAGIIAPISSVWDDPVFHQPNPVFGGQKVGELQCEMAKQMPSYTTGDLFFVALSEVGSMMPDMISGKITVDKGLADAQARILKEAEKMK